MGQQFVDLAVLVRRQASQHILQIRIRIMAIEPGTLNQTHHRSGTSPRPQGAGEQPIVATDGKRGVILPMSGKWWRSTTAGMRSTVVAYGGNTGSIEQLVTWFTLRLNLASSWLWRHGCSTLPFVQTWNWVNLALR